MRGNYSLNIGKIVELLFINRNTETKDMMFVRRYNNSEVSQHEIRETIDKFADVKMLYYQYRMDCIQKAYAPFLDWIRDIYYEDYADSMTIDEFLEKSNVYSLHIITIKKYIESGEATRYEQYIMCEIYYEMTRFLESIFNILRFVGERKSYLLVFNNLHFSGGSTIRLFNYFLNSMKSIRNIKMLLLYNEAYQVDAYVYEEWKQLINKAESKNILMDCGKDSTVDDCADECDIFVPRIENISEYVIDIRNMVATFALHQAENYLMLLNKTFEKEMKESPSEQTNDILVLYALTLLCLNKDNSAILVCDNALLRYGAEEYDVRLFWFNYIKCLALVSCRQPDNSIKFKDMCINIALVLENEKLEFLAEILEKTVYFRGWTQIFLYDTNYDISDSLLERCEKYGYYNHLARFYIFRYNVYLFENGIPMSQYGKGKICLDRELAEFNKGIEIANKIGNNALLLEAYKKNATIFSGIGYYDYVQEYYDKSMELLKLQSNTREQANILDGMGYNSLVLERFVEANEYFNQALRIAYNEMDIDIISATLYNMGMNAFVAGEYSIACDYLTSLTKITDSSSSSIMNICNISKIYGLIALCNYYLGVYYSSYLYVEKMERVLSHLLNPDTDPDYHLWDDDMFLYYLIQGLLLKKDNMPDLAQQQFDKLQFHLGRTQSIYLFGYTLYVIEQAKLYRQMGKGELADEILRDAIEYNQIKGNTYKTQQLICELDRRREIPRRWELGLKNISMDDLLKMANYIESESILKEKIRSIDFLALWQELLNKGDVTHDELISNANRTLKNYYDFDGIIYIRVINDKPVVEYCDTDIPMKYEDFDRFLQYFNKYKRAFVVSRLEKRFFEFSFLYEIFGLNKIVSMLGIPLFSGDKLDRIMFAYTGMRRNFTIRTNVLSEEVLSIVQYAFVQFIETLDKFIINEQVREMNNELIRINEKLELMAITDQLTGLYNRKSFNSIINEFSDKEKYNTVLYIDLDNFKYYNDNFGHEIGDEVLIRFANIFSNICKDSGYVIRYGGDEFIIILHDIDSDKASEYAKKIFEEIEKDRVELLQEIEKKKNGDISIPNDKRLSCSIGIAASKGALGGVIDELLRQADEALYIIKKNEKNSYKVWN